MDKKIRRSQLIQPFGVGAIVDINGEGFIVKDISRWRRKPGKRLELERLQQMLGGKALRSFSDNPRDDEAAVVQRFPRWYHCPICSHLSSVPYSHDQQNPGVTPTCSNPRCKGQALSPMRFVAYCDDGHLTDINWHRWCHRGGSEARNGHCADYDHLYFRTTGKSGGDFDQMIIECKADGCGAHSTLADITRGSASRDVVYARNQDCCGRQPWYSREDESETCALRMRIEPRGSSSIYRAKVLSALDIVSSSGAEDVSGDHFVDDIQFQNTLRRIKERYVGTTDLAIAEVEEEDGEFGTRIDILAEDLEVERTVVVKALVSALRTGVAGLQALGGDVFEVEQAQKKLLSGELQLFKSGINVNTTNLSIEFYDTTVNKNPLVSTIFASIGQVRKLREIRALTGFTRGKGARTVPVDHSGIQDWIPAIEAYGEGIYFELNGKTIGAYLAKVGDAIHGLVKPQQDALDKLRETYPIDIPDSQLFILTHTLSHLLIRQLTFNSGYSSSALRERIFVDESENYSGILIYTSDTDSEGTMGGLVEQARIERLSTIIEQCVEAAFWCSADPVCRETENQGFAGLNRASCHCCSLVSETSCMYQNAMLNRLTLGGLGEQRHEVLGFLSYVRSMI